MGRPLDSGDVPMYSERALQAALAQTRLNDRMAIAAYGTRHGLHRAPVRDTVRDIIDMLERTSEEPE